mgnify:CR=1 FL=1
MVETLRKLVLTGFAVFFAQGALLQLIMSLGFMLLYGLWLTKVQPDKNRRDYYYSLLTSIVLLLFMFTALLLEVDKSLTQMENMAEQDGFKLRLQGYSNDTLAYALIILVITGTVLGIYYVPGGEGDPSPAYASMEYIMTQLPFGYILRAVHHWTTHFMVAAVFLLVIIPLMTWRLMCLNWHGIWVLSVVFFVAARWAVLLCKRWRIAILSWWRKW